MEQNHVFDFHCHLVPGVDDGSKNMEESLAALREDYDQDVRWVICTPHVTADLSHEAEEKIKTSFSELERRLKETDFGSEMEIYLGCEFMYSESLADRLAAGELWTMAGSSYILVEFLPSAAYEELYQAVRRLCALGYIPILAHVERYLCLHKNADKFREMNEAGAYFQINTPGLNGTVFNKKTAYVRGLCKSGLIHFLGTDSHGMAYRRPDMKKGVQWVMRNCDRSLGEKMLYRNGLAVLNDAII